MMTMTNCPNCGAPIRGYKCEYCETVFSQPKAEIKIIQEKSSFLKRIILLEEYYNNTIKAMEKLNSYTV